MSIKANNVVQTEPESNMALWKRVQSTDPKYTKDTTNGRYKFTCVDPQYQLQKATELWGPYGFRWGLRKISWGQLDHDGVMTMMLSAEFFYPTASFEITVDAKFRHGDDCCKKLLTSARSKALSYLGFSADVFMGKFEDEQYVKGAGVKYGKRDQFMRVAAGRIRTADSLERLEELREKTEEMVADETIEAEQGRDLMEEIAQREAELRVG